MKNKQWIAIIMILMLTGCASTSKKDLESMTVTQVDIPKFMGRWYVLAGRFTSFEKDVHNGIESYAWNEKEERIDIDFKYNQGSLTGEEKSIPQKGWIYNDKTNAHWKVQPFWPLKFDYLIVALAPDYSWTAVGVPDQKYLWIMARSPENAESKIESAVQELKKINYSTDSMVRVPHESTMKKEK